MHRILRDFAIAARAAASVSTAVLCCVGCAEQDPRLEPDPATHHAAVDASQPPLPSEAGVAVLGAAVGADAGVLAAPVVRADAGPSWLDATTGEPAKAPAAAPSAAVDTWPAECDYRLKVAAHGDPRSGDTSKYSVAAKSQYTMAFFFKAPWGDTPVHFLKAKLLLDNARVVHHWTLFAGDDAKVVDGAVEGGPSTLTPMKMASESFVTGGGPGSDPIFAMPEGVGLRMPAGPSAFLRLEVHYYNAANDRVEQDASGFELCATSRKRPNEAAVHWLGTYVVALPENAETEVTSRCAPSSTAGPVHLMLAAPHMHQTGTHARMILHRKGAGDLTLLDQPYSFQEQRGYPLPLDGSAPDVLMNPGDSITSTCRYRNTSPNPIFWGEASQDEMCFFVVLAWPVGRLSNGSLLGGPLGAPPDVSCLEPF